LADTWLNQQDYKTVLRETRKESNDPLVGLKKEMESNADRLK